MIVRPNSFFRLGTAGWDPLRDFERFSSDLNHLFRDSYSINGLLPLAPRLGASFSKTEDGLKMRMELPGMEPDSFQVSVQGEELILKASPTDKDAGVNRTYLRRERVSPKIDNRIQLGFLVDAERVKASYTNGILEVELPKLEAKFPKPISIAIH